MNAPQLSKRYKSSWIVWTLIGTLFFFGYLPRPALAQSNLPPCSVGKDTRKPACFGTFVFPDGRKYVGEFRDGWISGQGTYSWPNGNQYVGQFSEDQFNGQGTFKWADGRQYAGEFRKGMRVDGKGIYVWPNGSKYEGEFKNELMNGLGTYTWPDGRAYAGQFKDGSMTDGKGAYSWPDGRKYVGDFKNEQINGTGTFTWPDGRQFTGEFKDGNRADGKGIFNWADGRKYVGEFKGGKYHGLGTLYDTDGRVLKAGLWDNEKFVKAVAVPDDANSIVVPDEARKQLEAARERQKQLRDTQIAAEKSELAKKQQEAAEARKLLEEALEKQRLAREALAAAEKLENARRQQEAADVKRLQDEAQEKQRLAREVQAAAEKLEAAKKQRETAEVELAKTEAAGAEAAKKRLVSNDAAGSVKIPPMTLGKRVALVIGNSAYKAQPLVNPVNDSSDMAKVLRTRGFEVIALTNARLSEMRKAAREFSDKIVGSDVALVYYSGHGVELNGRNFFIPVEADIQRDYEVSDQAYDANQITDMMQSIPSASGQRVNILIVDACRDNPLARSWRSASRGLAKMDAPAGTFIAFSTAPGKVASDGEGRNSPFTKHLLTAIQQPNQPIEQVFKSVRKAVIDETRGVQVPWENSSLIGDFFFTIVP